MASYADVVESVDRAKLVGPLNRGAHEQAAPVDVLLQVSLDPPGREGRQGADPDDLAALAAAVERGRHAAAARADGRGAAGRGPRGGVRAGWPRSGVSSWAPTPTPPGSRPG